MADKFYSSLTESKQVDGGLVEIYTYTANVDGTRMKVGELRSYSRMDVERWVRMFEKRELHNNKGLIATFPPEAKVSQAAIKKLLCPDD